MSVLRSSSDGLRLAGISKPSSAALTEACTSATTWSCCGAPSPNSSTVIGGPPSLSSPSTTVLAAASIGRVTMTTAG